MKLKENYFLSRLVGFGVLLGGIKYFDKVKSKAFKQGYDKGYSHGKDDGFYERGEILKKEVKYLRKRINFLFFFF